MNAILVPDHPDGRVHHVARGTRPRAFRHALVLLLALGPIACSSDSPTGPTGPFAGSPNDAELLVSDVTNFWTAYAEYERAGSRTSFQTLYLDKASPGLKDFIQSRSLTASNIAAMVNGAPRYFAAAKSASAQLENGAVSQQIRSGYARLKELYPAAVFPPITFLIGRFSTGGTTAGNRILIGSEFYLANVGVPTDELQPFQYNNVHPVSFLPIIVAHEHTHILQQQAQGIFGHKTLLEQSGLEGGADFIGELISGGNINAKIRDWAIPREHALWVEFQAAMGGTDVSRWLYDQGASSIDRPGDLGYFVGYRIAEAYYAKATNKTQAVKDIIEVSNATTYLNASGYNP